MRSQNQNRKHKRKSKSARSRQVRYRRAKENIDIPLDGEETEQKKTVTNDSTQSKQKQTRKKTGRRQKKRTSKRKARRKKNIPSVWAVPSSGPQKNASYKRRAWKGEWLTHIRQYVTPPLKAKREVGIFICGMLVVLSIIPIGIYGSSLLQAKDNLAMKVRAGKILLKDSATSGNWSQVERHFASLESEFAEIAHTLPRSSALSGRLVSVFPPGKLLVKGNNMLKHAQEGSRYGARIADQLAHISTSAEDTKKMETLTKPLIDTAQVVHKMIPEMQATLAGVRTDLKETPQWLLPSSVVQKTKQANTQIPQLQDNLRDGENYLDILLKFAGQKYKRKYLFIFQNNQEVRATGGFIGTHGVMSMHEGKVENLDIQSIYDADGQLRENVIPPKPLQVLTKRWHLRDANWFADFPTSAENIIQFYEQTGGPTVDGVIAFTPPVIRDLVEIVGPIPMPKYDTTVTADKFVRIVQQETSVDYDRERNDPKAFINDLAPRLLERMFTADKDKHARIAQALMKGAQRKHMLLYMQDDEVQQTLEEYQLAGSLLEAPQDYLSVVNSNIGGKKTDGVIEQQIDHRVAIADSGEVQATVTITREHNGGNTKYPRWNAVNKDYMRIFVPKGSTIVDSEGFEDYTSSQSWKYTGAFQRDEKLRTINDTRKEKSEYNLETSVQHNKTVFAGWTTTKPQGKSTVSITYTLPFNLTAGQKKFYSLITQKQSGTPGSRYTLTIDFPEENTVSWKRSSLDISSENGTVSAKTVLRTDQYFGGILSP